LALSRSLPLRRIHLPSQWWRRPLVVVLRGGGGGGATRIAEGGLGRRRPPPPPVLRDDAPVRRAATDDDDRVRVSVVLVSRTPAIAPIRGLWRRRPGPPASPSPSSSSSITKALSATMALPVNASEFRSAASGSPFSFRSFPRCCLQSLAGHTLSTQTDWHFQRQI